MDVPLTVMPPGFAFGSVPACEARETEFLLRNVGRASIEVSRIAVEGPDDTYLAILNQQGSYSLQSGHGDKVEVRFAPMKLGELPATLVIQSDASQRVLRIPLKGTGGLPNVTASAEQVGLGRIEVGRSSHATLSLMGHPRCMRDVTTELEGTDRDEFSISSGTLGADGALELDLAFNPVRVGPKSVALVVKWKGSELLRVAVEAEALDRAVVAEPPRVDFGGVPVDKEKTLLSGIRNISTQPMVVTGLTLKGLDASFSQQSRGFPLVLQPGELRQWEVRFSPSHKGLGGDIARFHVESTRNPTTDVVLEGHGGAAELCVSPMGHDFGTQPLGSKKAIIVNIKNCGAENGGPLKLIGLEFQPDSSGPVQFNIDPLALPHLLEPGKELNLKVFYEPTRDGPAAGALVLTTNGFNAGSVRLDFRGDAQRREPCKLAVTPVPLNFGTVPPRKGAVLGVKLENQGQDLCPVKNIRIRDDGGGVFRMPGGDVHHVIEPRHWFSFQVAFTAPETGGSFLGSVQIEQADPANPLSLVPLQAHSERGCLVPTPRFVDFGFRRGSCPPAVRQVSYLNACSSPITVSGVRLGPGTMDNEFALRSAPALPLTLQPGEAFSVEVGYYARTMGMNLSPLFVDTSDLPEPLLVPLLGESPKDPDKKDTFVQQDGSKVDVLFVVDNTASMVEEQPRFTAALPAFVNTALDKKVDLHVAVTTTGIDAEPDTCPDGAHGGEAGRIFPVDGSQRILTHQTPDLAGRLQANAQVGQCASVEQGFEAVRRALSEPLVSSADDPRTPQANDGNMGFLRDEAALVVVFVGDEDDHSPDSVDTYVRFFQGKKGEFQPQRTTIYAIAPTAAACSTAGGTGTRYAEAAARTGGEVLSVCAADYAPLLQNVATKAFSPQDRFPLSELPDPGSVAVRVNGKPVSGDWRYDGVTNAVVFSQSPVPGAQVEITYRLACQ